MSQQIGISTVANPDGSTSIYTDSGVTLFQGGHAQHPALHADRDATPLARAAMQVMVDGVAITGSSSPMAIQSGALAGLANLRDVVAPQYGAQLDQIADGLISAFSESDQTGGTAPTLPGLFTFAGATGVPSTSATTGLASEIEVNATVDPSQGGDVNLLRDGGINDRLRLRLQHDRRASYTGRIEHLISATTSTQTFSGAAGLGTSSSLSDYANASVSWLQSQNQQASNQLDYQNSVVSQATTALSNATGVNLDTEMTNMLTIENSYTTTAKLLTTVNDMFTSLLNAV